MRDMSFNFRSPTPSVYVPIDSVWIMLVRSCDACAPQGGRYQLSDQLFINVSSVYPSRDSACARARAMHDCCIGDDASVVLVAHSLPRAIIAPAGRHVIVSAYCVYVGCM